MKLKLFSLFAFSIFAMVLFVGAVSALTFNPPSLDIFTYEGQSQILNVTGVGTISYNWVSDPHVFSVDTINNQTNYSTFNITLNSLPSEIGEYINTINFTNSTDSKILDLKYAKTFCKYGDQNDSELTLNVDVENKGQGDDDKWLPLDTIEVKVELENNFDKDGDMDLNDVVFELGLYEKGSDKNIARDMIWVSDDDEEYEYGDIDEDEDGTHTFEFRINPEEINEEGDYLLMVKAYPSGEEDNVCIDHSSDLSNTYFEEIKIEKESDRDKMVVIDEETLPQPIEASCGQQATFTADVWNIGDKDFDDQIMVTLYNKELGIDEKEIALGDLDAGEKAAVSFTFEIPQDAEEKQYILYMRTFYDYDEGDGKYEGDYDRMSEDTFVAYLKISGDCVVKPEVGVSATLESEARAGKEMEIKITLENTGSETRTFVVDLGNYNAWAEISEAPETLAIDSGSSKETYAKLNVNGDASGEKTFNILIYEGTELIKTQPVSVNIEPRGFLGITGFSIQGNKYLWGLGLLNVILVLVIIIVAVRVARRK